jgi:hypothetical protein
MARHDAKSKHCKDQCILYPAANILAHLIGSEIYTSKDIQAIGTPTCERNE